MQASSTTAMALIVAMAGELDALKVDMTGSPGL